jgi:DNA-binding response OmpR family regulator
MSRILIVEDEPHIADGLRYNLDAEGHEASVANDGERALDIILRDKRPFDVMVLDVMLPGKDGFAVATELRAAGEFIPILMLTARGRPEDVLRGFEAGVDDYLPKPFELRTLDFSAMEVRTGDKSYRLTQMECELLRYFVKKAGQPVSRREILEDVWGLHEETDTRAIDNFIVRLRRYLEDRPAAPRYLQTVRGVGYRFVPTP